MSITNFIPEVWSAKLLVAYQHALRYGNAVNTDYEGEISALGDKVRITSIGDVTIKDYSKNTDIDPPQEMDDAQTALEITQAKYFNIYVDDVDKRQAAGQIMTPAMNRAAYGLRNYSDQFIAGLYPGVAAGMMIGSDAAPIVPTAANAYEYLVDMSIMLDEQDVPEDGGRFCFVPPWYHGLLQKDDRYVKYDSSQKISVMETGVITEIDGMTIYESNNVPSTAGAKYKVMAGHKDAIGFASQINETEAYRPQSRFGDAVKGLVLYGAKLLRPTAIVVGTFNKS